MENQSQLKEAFEAASLFLRPVLTKDEVKKNPGRSLIEWLDESLPGHFSAGSPPRERVVRRCLELLTKIHQAFIQECRSQVPPEDRNTGLEDARRRRVLYALLDLVSLEGIYPSLSPGVGIPLEKRVISSLPTGVVAKQDGSRTGSSSKQGEFLLVHIILSIRDILQDDRPSIQSIILERLLSDLISGTAELAFHSRFISRSDTEDCSNMLLKIVNETPTPTLLQVLTSLLNPTPPSWFKVPIAQHLSRTPLRKDGVFQVITFLAFHSSPSEFAIPDPATGPSITVQAIMQSSQLLSSVPQGTSVDEFLLNVGPKLLSLLDGEDPDLRKTAAYIIGNGMLTKRPMSAPGTIGFDIFVKPIFDTLNGNINGSSSEWLRKFNRDGSPSISESLQNSDSPCLASSSQISLSLARLMSLTLLHPNPTLLRRLVGPVLLSIWGLYWFTKFHANEVWEEHCLTLLQNFFSVSSDKARFEKLIRHIMWDGGATWKFNHDSNGKICITSRETNEMEQADVIQLVESIDERVGMVSNLLDLDPQKSAVIGEMFLVVSREWLLGEPDSSKAAISPGDIRSNLQKVVYAKLTEKIIQQYKEILCYQPKHILLLVEQLLDSEIRGVRDRKVGDINKPTLQSLGNIVENQNATALDSTESSEPLGAALSLLSTLLTSPEFRVDEEISLLLETLKSKIDTFLPFAPSTLRQPATAASMLLEFTLSGSLEIKPQSIPKASHVSDIEAHRQALNSLNSQLPPVQAEGLSLLSQLVKKSSPVLDIPATLTTLLCLILNDGQNPNSNDEFVYLNVITLIGTLASKHPRTVISALAERYKDSNEEITLDDRLRIGEALLRTVQDLGEALVGDAARILGETMVSVAGRRGKKPKANYKRKQDVESQKREHDEAEDEESSIEDLGIETADLMNQLVEQADQESEDPTEIDLSKKILQTWAAGAVSDENPDDLRVRTSAMSILGTALSTNLSGLGQRAASASVDMALSTLTLESGPENAIIRRAAAMLLLDLLKSLEALIESGKNPGFTFAHSREVRHNSYSGSIGNIPDILRVLTFVESKETDSIARGHLRILIESFEAWTERSILRGIIGTNSQPRFSLDSLAGLDIQPLSENKEGHRKITEIE